MSDKSLYLPQYLRCYMEPGRKIKAGRAPRKRRGSVAETKTSPPRPPPTPEEMGIKEIGFPYEGWCFTFDCETTTDTRQVLRVGAYAVHGISRNERLYAYSKGRLTRELLDTPCQRGVFYDPAELTADEIATLKQYARVHGMRTCETAEFIKKVFYYWVYERHALCIGHNLPFDLSRLATDWGEAKKTFYGGFWLKLCDCIKNDSDSKHEGNCRDHPAILIKTLGSKKTRMRFRSRKDGRFLDTCTFGLALLGPGDPTLEGMGKRFKAATLKQAWAGEHGGRITIEYLDYLADDVESTWSLYRAEREVFKQHGVSTEPWKIYSEASLGKAYFKDIGVPSFLKQAS